eukprot:353827_1
MQRLQRATKYLKVPSQSSFWVSKPIIRTTNSCRGAILECQKNNWISNYATKDISSKLNTYQFIEHLFPDLCDDRLLTVMKWTDWYFYFDDQFDIIDNENQHNNLKLLQNQSSQMHQIIKTGTTEKADDPIIKMFYDITKDVLAHNNNYPNISTMFWSEMKTYMDGVTMMNQLKSYKSADLSASEYLKIRGNDVGCRAYLSLIYLLYPEFRESGLAPLTNPIVYQMKELAKYHCALCNDILGINKDIKENYDLNYVLLLQNESADEIEQSLSDTIG